MSSKNPFEQAHELIDVGDARMAVKIANAFAERLPMDWRVAFSLGGILIDAGGDLRKRSLVKEGVGLLKEHFDETPEDYKAEAHYNLGNGYLILGDCERGIRVGTRASLTEAVSHFNKSLSMEDQTKTRVNLAGALVEQGRYIEVADVLDSVLIDEPDHHVALARRAQAYVKTYDWSLRHEPLLLVALDYYRQAAKAAQDTLSYHQRYEELTKWLEARIGNSQLPRRRAKKTRRATRVQKWIWDHQLALNMCPHCREHSPDAFDTSIVGNFLVGGTRHPPLGDVYDLINSLYRGFGAARWCLLQGMGIAKIGHSGLVLNMPSSSASTNNLEIGLVLSAFSGFYSILDQIAFALNSYLRLGHPEDYVSFGRVWNPRGSKSRETPKHGKDVHQRVRRLSTPAMSALHRLALSFDRGGGMYERLRVFRNTLEHRVLVPMATPSSSSYFSTETQDNIAANAVTMGRIAKAAMLYFGAVVWRAEFDRMKRAQRSGTMVRRSDGLNVRRV